RGQPRHGPPPLVRSGTTGASGRARPFERRGQAFLGDLEPAPDRDRELDRGTWEIQVRTVEHAELDEVGARWGHGASLVSPGRPRDTGGTPGLATRRRQLRRCTGARPRPPTPSVTRPPPRGRPRGRRASGRRSPPGCGCRTAGPGDVRGR